MATALEISVALYGHELQSKSDVISLLEREVAGVERIINLTICGGDAAKQVELLPKKKGEGKKALGEFLTA